MDKIIYIENVDKTNDISSLNLVNGKYEVVFKSGPKKYEYRPSKIRIVNNQLTKKSNQTILNYYKEIAKQTSIVVETDDGDLINVLESQYKKIDRINPDTVISSFLNGEFKTNTNNKEIIYPFGLNISQKDAVDKALTNQVSIIDGPPGTGKTQTILNIVANAIIRGKKIAVVSNNNSAISNVLEKLEKYNFDFLVSFLGNKDNKKKFIDEQNLSYPNDLKNWKIEKEEYDDLLEKIKDLEIEIPKKLELKNRIAALNTELLSYEPEKYYYQEHIKNIDIQLIDVENLSNIDDKKVLEFITELEFIGDELSIFRKILLYFKYGKKLYKLLNNPTEQTIVSLQNLFYTNKTNKINKEIDQLVKELDRYDFDSKLNELSDYSIKLFKSYLCNKYNKNILRPQFLLSDLDRKPNEFINEYPIILSTTHSIRKSLDFNYIYDYLIIDESSQVDLVTGALALSCTRNVVIVGDNKQLPNVIDQNSRDKISIIDNNYRIDDKHAFIVDGKPHTLLDAAHDVWTSVPETMLKEHYRCNSKIINFCNLMFYDNQLIIMTEDNCDKPLSLYLTAEGNHARGHYNQRQIDVIKDEIIPNLEKRGFSDIGIIAPYNDQVVELRKQIGNKYQIDTVHKYQGREKEAIILSSVDNTITDFGDDPNLLNVAISRAKKSLSVVISDNENNWNTNYGQLKKYIEYNNLDIVRSNISSVFDLLYKSKKEERDIFLSKHRKISEYDSENLLQSIIDDILLKDEYKNIYCRNHYLLYDLISNYDELTQEEIDYCRHGSHIDFLLFNFMDKKPVLAIELDGISYHKKGSVQSNRDELKDSILEKNGLPLLRIKTNESMEKDRIEDKLKDVLNLK